MSVVIRSAAASDYDQIIAALDEWWGGRKMTAMLPRLFFDHFQPWTYVAEEKRDTIAFLSAFRSQANETQAYCHFIGVSPGARSRGIGEALDQRLFVDARAAGCHEVLAVTSPADSTSIAFHRGLGFTVLPSSQVWDAVPYVANYDGPGQDRVRFSKRLDENPPNWWEEPIEGEQHRMVFCGANTGTNCTGLGFSRPGQRP